MTDEMRLAMLISGGGTTMEQIIIACQRGLLRGLVEPSLVISSRYDAGGITKALLLGLSSADVIVLPRRDFPDQLAWGEAIFDACRHRGIDIVGQYGWLPFTPANVINAFPDAMINQHPGPLDPGRQDFGGKGMIGRAVHAARLLFVREVGRDFWTEATAQRVAKEYDKGAVLAALTVDINKDDDPISLQQRVLPKEHTLQVEVLRQFATGTIHEVVRAEPLVKLGEEEILERAKQAAALLFPHG